VLAEGVSNAREFAEAVKDRQKVLAREHPEAKADVLELLAQMGTTVEGLAAVTSVATRFRFTTKGTDVDRQPSRFNDYVISEKEKVAGLRKSIRNLKGSCDKIR